MYIIVCMMRDDVLKCQLTNGVHPQHETAAVDHVRLTSVWSFASELSSFLCSHQETL